MSEQELDRPLADIPGSVYSVDTAALVPLQHPASEPSDMISEALCNDLTTNGAKDTIATETLISNTFFGQGSITIKSAARLQAEPLRVSTNTSMADTSSPSKLTLFNVKAPTPIPPPIPQFQLLDAVAPGLHENATPKWYLNMDGNNKSQSISNYTRAHFITGFNLTAVQYDIMEERLVDLLKPSDAFLLPARDRDTFIKFFEISKIFKIEFGRELKKDGIPEWWIEEAVKGWVKKTAAWMKQQGEKLDDQIQKLNMRVLRAAKGEEVKDRYIPKGKRQADPDDEDSDDHDSSKTNRTHKRNKTQDENQLMLYKNCHFVVTVRGDIEQKLKDCVFLSDLITGRRPRPQGTSDLKPESLKYQLLEHLLKTSMNLDRNNGDRLVYVVDNRNGEVDIECGESGDAWIRNAAIMARKFGSRSISLEIIRGDGNRGELKAQGELVAARTEGERKIGNGLQSNNPKYLNHLNQQQSLQPLTAPKPQHEALQPSQQTQQRAFQFSNPPQNTN